MDTYINWQDIYEYTPWKNILEEVYYHHTILGWSIGDIAGILFIMFLLYRFSGIVGGIMLQLAEKYPWLNTVYTYIFRAYIFIALILILAIFIDISIEKIIYMVLTIIFSRLFYSSKSTVFSKHSNTKNEDKTE